MSEAGETERIVDALTMMSRAMVALAMRNLDRVDATVTLQQFRTLVTLVGTGPIRVSDLARKMGVQSSTMTRMCDRLVRKGLVSRHERIEDRRAAWVSLTADGRELVGRGMSSRRAEIAFLVEQVDLNQPIAEFIEAFSHASGDITNEEWWHRLGAAAAES